MISRRVRIVAGLLGLLVAGAALWIWFGPLPSIEPSRFATTTIVDRNGVVLYEPLAASGTRGEWLRADELPMVVMQATVAAEDKRFFKHHGIDAIAVCRAALHDVKRMRIVEGGSTITQQVAKLLLYSPRRGVIDKMHEAIIALRLERHYTKREILALYLNLAPYGNLTTGIARASRRYFGIAPENLTAAQAAFLASLPQRPGAFNPLRDPKRAAARQRMVLANMERDGYLSKRALAEARAERLRFADGDESVLAQHFVERVLESSPSVEAGFSPPASGALKGAPTVRTTLDASLQRDVQGIIRAQRAGLLDHGAHSVAVAVLDNRTGEWLAWEGSGDYYGSTFGGAIDGVVALRQPGSTLKPFTYALAFEQGYTPATVLPDIPSNFPTAEEGIVYSPRNYDGQFRGPLRVRAALAGSENVPAVAMLNRIGPPSLLRLLRSAGFDDFRNTADHYGLGLTLGDAEVRLEQLVAGYAMFARGGVAVTPKFTQQPNNSTTRIISKRTAFWITDILSDSYAREYIFGSGGNLDFPFPVAVKTGTSQSYRDNWTIGYTRDVTVGVWVGNFDRSELHHSTGVTGAGPIFHAVMLSAMKRARGRLPIGDDTPIVERPDDVELRPVCALSGLRPSTSCPNIETEWVAKGAPVEFCSWHHEGRIDWPAEYRPWAKSHGLLDERPRPLPYEVARQPLRVVSPPDGATYLIDPTLRMPSQTLRLRALSQSKLTWHVDEHPLATARPNHPVDWPLRPGTHTITAVDEEGNRDQVRIVVK